MVRRSVWGACDDVASVRKALPTAEPLGCRFRRGNDISDRRLRAGAILRVEMARPDPITVFISYAHEDVSLARAIQERLEDQGFEVWIDEGALRAGDSLIQSIATAIHEMEFVVALI